jgi:hypothetical protein
MSGQAGVNPVLAPSVADPRFETLLRRVRNEFLEMPGLHLTAAQARRLWQIRDGECEALLQVLVNSGFLTRTRTGAFVKTGSGSAGA